jgi:hypothetical protein
VAISAMEGRTGALAWLVFPVGGSFSAVIQVAKLLKKEMSQAGDLLQALYHINSFPITATNRQFVTPAVHRRPQGPHGAIS